MSFREKVEYKANSSLENHEDQYSVRGGSSRHLVDDSHSAFNNSDDGSSLYTIPHVKEGTKMSRFIDSFKPMNLEDDGVDTSIMTDLEKSIYATARHPLARRLKSRHLNMIAIGYVPLSLLSYLS